MLSSRCPRISREATASTQARGTANLGGCVGPTDGAADAAICAPARTEKTRAASSTLRAKIPTWSRLQDSGVTPSVLIRPYVPLNPTMPQ